MKSKGKRLRERICALALAGMMLLTGILPQAGVTVKAATGDPIDVTFQVTDGTNAIAGATVTVDSSSIQTDDNGEATITGLTEGTEYTYTVNKDYYGSVSNTFTAGATTPVSIIISKEVTAISLNASATTMEINGTCTITATTSPTAGKPCTWKSSDSTIASVSNGVVTGTKAGKATITAEYGDVKSQGIEIEVTKIKTNIGLATIVEPSTKEDATSITCTATGAPTGASLRYYVNDTKFYEGTDTSVTYQNTDNNLIGNLTFKVEYDGTDIYEGSNATATVDDLYRNQRIVFTDTNNSNMNPRIETRPAKGESDLIFDIEIDNAKSVIQGDISYTTTSDLIRVDPDGKVTVKAAEDGNKKSGLAEITVQAASKDTYWKESIATYYVYVQEPIDIGELADQFTVCAEKTYNRETNLDEVKATLPVNCVGIYTGTIDATQPLSFVFKGTAEKEDADTYRNEEVTLAELVKIFGYDSNGTEIDLTSQITVLNYSNTKLSGEVTIHKKKVTLGTDDATVEYAKDAKTVKEQFAAASKEYGTNGKVKVTNDAAELLESDGIDVAAFKATVEDTEAECGHTVGTEPIIKPELIEPNSEFTNYEFVEDNADLGKTTITEADLTEEQLVEIIDFYSENAHVYTDKEKIGTVWIGGGNLKAKIRTSSDYEKFFDAVVSKEENLTQNGYITTENTTYDIKKRICLQRDGKSLTNEKEFTIVVDQTAPGFTFGEWEEGKTITDAFVQAVTFNKYKQTHFTLEGVKPHDDLKTDTNGLDVTQSGEKEWSYKIYKTQNTEEVTKEDLESFAADTNISWKKAESDATSIPVAVLTGDVKKEDLGGNYIVLVNVIDNVGNEVTLTSEGMILDYEQPKVSILGAAGEKLDNSLYYNGDIEYQVRFKDETVTSGFKSAKIEIIDNTVVQETIEYDFLKIYSKEKGIKDEAGNDLEDLNKGGGYTLTQISELATRELTTTTGLKDGKALKIEEPNSNTLKIKVTAYDQSGNETIAEQELMVDNEAPEITVEYSSKDKDGNNVEAQNDKYFKEPREMVITYREKNFDAGGVTFDVLAGSNINLDELKGKEPVSVSDLADYGITVVMDKNGDVFTDSEPDGEPYSYTSSRTNTITLRFDKDNEYYIRPHCKDLANNYEEEINYDDKETAKTTFVIDRTPPVIQSVEYLSEDEFFVSASKSAKDKPSSAYSQEDVKINLIIEEKNFRITEELFSEGQMNFAATKGIKAGNQEVDLSFLNKAKNAKEWCYNNNVYSCDLDFLVGAGENDAEKIVDTTGKDANYTFGFTYTDLAGNEVIYAPEYFTIDNDHPTGEFAVDGTSFWQMTLEVLTFGIFKNKESTVTLTGDDETAGVDKIYYYKTSEYLTKTQFDALEDNNSWIEGTTFSVTPNEQYVVYEKVVDKARNVTYRYPENGVIADNKGPIIDLADSSPTINGFHNGDATVSVNVEDPIFGNTYSGIKYVWYQIVSTGNVVNATPSERTVAYTLKDNTSNSVKSEANRTYTGKILVPAKDFNSNEVKVTVYAEDFAGVVTHNEIKLKIDITAPVVENIRWNTSAASNGKYYNETRVATITVRERNFDPNQIRFNITNTDGSAAQISGWSVDSSGTSDNNINTCTVTFSADGDYNMNMSCTDKAGWTSNTVTAEEFTIDKTVPTINVSFDNNNAANGKYYNAARTATITVDEHNFNGSEVQTAITSNTAAPSVNGWGGGGDVHTASVPFTADGNYSFTVNYTDLAGNQAQVYNVDEFVVDMTKPEIEIFDIEDKSANNGEVAPGVRYSDTNYDVNGISITYSGSKHTEKAVDGARSNIPEGESIKMADFEHTAETDDVYTMVAKVTDLAGNSDEKEVTFSVNRFGSNFIFSDETEGFLDDYYNNEEETLVVTEINVDTLTHRGIASGHDGNMIDLEEGTDYSVKESGSEVSWKSYEYTIKKDNFEEEGLYNITIDSVDRATNQVNNKIKKADIEFVIDKTAPTVVITGVESGKQYRTNERDITIAATDNVAMERVEFFVDDDSNPAEKFNAKTIQRQKGELPYTLTSSSDWQEIKAVAVDKAGNITDTSKTEEGEDKEWISVLVTSNLFVQFYRNTPLLIVSLVVLLGLGGFFFLILAKRRKKEEEG